MPTESTSHPLTIALAETPHAHALAECLKKLGARLLPFAKNSQNSGAIPLERWIVQLIEGEFDDVVFTSAQGVHLMIEMARQLEKSDAFLDALSVARKVARGPKAARALSELGVAAEVVTKSPELEALLAAVAGLGLEGRVVGVQPFEKVAELALAQTIEDVGGTARVVAPVASVDPEALELLEKLERKEAHGIVFLTERTAAWLFDACRVSGLEEQLVRTLRAQPVLAAEAATGLLRRRGVHPDLVLSHATVMQPVERDLAQTLGLWESAAPRVGQSPVGKHRVVIVGNGMVGYKLCDRLTEKEEGLPVRITVLGEETWPAYDRVHLSEYFCGKGAEDLVLAPADWYAERGIELRLGQRAARVQRDSRVVVTNSGEEVPYDSLVLATGAAPFVPPVPGLDKSGVFVYRTIEDLEAITAYAKGAKSAAVIGGGLLGLEAAKAARDLGLVTHVVEQAPRLMPRQLDDAGAKLLQRQIESLGLRVHLGVRTVGVLGVGSVMGLRFSDGGKLDVDMVIVSAGIRPRDQLAVEAGLEVFERGGVIVDDALRTSDPNVYALGECAIHRGTLYGLVAPGYEMATALGKTLRGTPGEFRGADMSTKLKLLGVEVASLGDPFADEGEGTSTVVYQDWVKGVYKKLIVSADGKRLLGAILVGDTAEYASLLPYARSGDELPVAPEELLIVSRSGGGAPLATPDTAQVCSCNAVTKLDIVQAIGADDGCTLDSIKKCTKAGTGCGGCLPLVTDIFDAEMLARGKSVKRALCEHFEFSRQELYDLVRVKGHRTFRDVIQSHGQGSGCEICKPAVAAILASVHAEPITNHATIQDTNDRFLANIQRGGTYSVVPRIPAGEITPEKLQVIAGVAQKYGLYTKITGGQRIDLFGARVEELPDIWEELVNAGFESGHAYGKSVRTVKSCVGSTWCRYGVQDSVGFAVRVEERYKGLRSPHKLKGAVSGCVRECAEAQSKDFGLIATEKGWNLYVCGNGGAKPRHADLLASDVDGETAIRYIDRFLMYYIKTADRLTRTSVWLEKLEGGIEHVRDVVVNDSLGLAAEFEREMQELVDSFVCEWTDVVRNPEKRALFQRYADPASRAAAARDAAPPMVSARGQSYPGPWPAAPLSDKRRLPVVSRSWVRVAEVKDVPPDGGVAVRYGRVELALFHFESRGEWFVTQNLCPHKRELVLSRGLLGDQAGIPKVACPFHKKTFSLETGECLSGDELSIQTFPARVEGGWVYAELPSESALEQALAPACQVSRPDVSQEDAAE